MLPSRGSDSESDDDGLVMNFEAPRCPVKRQRSESTLTESVFEDCYVMSNDVLGRGAYAVVKSCVNSEGEEFAVKIIEKRPDHSRTRIIKEIELFHLCSGHPNIVQLIEFFEERDKFYLVFEKMHGGPLLNHIQQRVHFTEHEASIVAQDIAEALKFLHSRGIAHRDLKPENILCSSPTSVCPVKLCDLDLASKLDSHSNFAVTTPELKSPVGSAEFMAPEVVHAFIREPFSYDKKCDLWSLGVIIYIMLCGYPPFYGSCWREDCGWDRGETCFDCQDTLFRSIESGRYTFPEEDWAQVSDAAKDLISHLLIKDVKLRYQVEDVVRHPFLAKEVPRLPLPTPEVLQRNDSARDLTQLVEHFNTVNRVMLSQRLSQKQQRRVNMDPTPPLSPTLSVQPPLSPRAQEPSTPVIDGSSKPPLPSSAPGTTFVPATDSAGGGMPSAGGDAVVLPVGLAVPTDNMRTATAVIPSVSEITALNFTLPLPKQYASMVVSPAVPSAAAYLAGESILPRVMSDNRLALVPVPGEPTQILISQEQTKDNNGSDRLQQRHGNDGRGNGICNQSRLSTKLGGAGDARGDSGLVVASKKRDENIEANVEEVLDLARPSNQKPRCSERGGEINQLKVRQMEVADWRKMCIPNDDQKQQQQHPISFHEKNKEREIEASEEGQMIQRGIILKQPQPKQKGMRKVTRKS